MDDTPRIPLREDAERFECTPEQLCYFLPSCILQELADPTSALRAQAFEEKFGAIISDHPYFHAEVEHPPLTEEEQEFLREECGKFLPRTVSDLATMRALLSQRGPPDEEASNKRRNRCRGSAQEECNSREQE